MAKPHVHQYKVRFFEAVINNSLYKIKKLWDGDIEGVMYFVIKDDMVIAKELSYKQAMKHVPEIGRVNAAREGGKNG